MSKDKEKDPAFLMYSRNWIQGTASFTPSEKGVYIDLLCHQHQDNGLPISKMRLARLVGLSESEFETIWTTLSEKFYEKEGKLWNKKLESVITGRKDFSEMRSIVGTFGLLLKQCDLSEEKRDKIRNKFNFREFIGIEKDELSKMVSKWLANMIANGTANGSIMRDVSLANDANANANANLNTDAADFL